MKFPYIQFYVADWLSDSAVSACEPATRGILVDWLCRMHLDDRGGVISGTRDQLARNGRCSPVQCDAALADLKSTNAANVTERDGVVTVVNRRMLREDKERKGSKIRMQRLRGNAAVTPPVTLPLRSHSTETEPKLTTKGPDEKASSEGSFSSENGGEKHPKTPKKEAKLTQNQREIADFCELLLGPEWVNDSGKWVNRITGRGPIQKGRAEPEKVKRVMLQVQETVREGTLKTTAAACAEYNWIEFK